MEERLGELEEKVSTVEGSVGDLEDKVEELQGQVEELQNGQQEEAAPPELVKEKGYAYYNVTVQNVHETYTLSPGVFIVHRPLTSIDYIGKTIPPELEPLVEYGNITEFRGYVEELEGVLGVYTVDKPLGPGENATFIIKASTYKPRETYFSGIQMIVETNDGFALANNIALFNVGNGPRSSTTSASNYDAGTEENSAVGSGFEGGQPDPSRGDENIDNGTPTDPYRPVTNNPQISKTVMKVTITALLD